MLRLAENRLDVLRDVERLRPLVALSNASLHSNPLAEVDHYRAFAVFHLSALDILDGDSVTDAERLSARSRFANGA